MLWHKVNQRLKKQERCEQFVSHEASNMASKKIKKIAAKNAMRILKRKKPRS